MYYHARITSKPEGAKRSPADAVEVDLQRAELLSRIVLPFLNGQVFFCGGSVIDARRVEAVHFNETDQSSTELLPFIRAELSASSVVAFIEDIWYVTTKGKDVTRSILDEATLQLSVGRAPERDTETQPKTSNGVFIVHGHDIVLLDQTELLLRRWGLSPITSVNVPMRA